MRELHPHIEHKVELIQNISSGWTEIRIKVQIPNKEINDWGYLYQLVNDTVVEIMSMKKKETWIGKKYREWVVRRDARNNDQS